MIENITGEIDESIVTFYDYKESSYELWEFKPESVEEINDVRKKLKDNFLYFMDCKEFAENQLNKTYFILYDNGEDYVTIFTNQSFRSIINQVADGLDDHIGEKSVYD